LEIVVLSGATEGVQIIEVRDETEGIKNLRTGRR
jgi:hypothetical protein